MITGLYCHPRRKTTAEAARPRTGYRAAAGDVNAPVTAGVNLWLVTLTQPLFSFRSFTFSARDLIMLFGGFFLLFKATMELNERLEGKDSNNPTQRKGAKFWGGDTNCGTGRHLLTRLSDYRRRDGRPFTGHDGRRGYRYQPDVDGQQAVNAIC